jgi:hypothetical protein
MLGSFEAMRNLALFLILIFLFTGTTAVYFLADLEWKNERNLFSSLPRSMLSLFQVEI